MRSFKSVKRILLRFEPLRKPGSYWNCSEAMALFASLKREIIDGTMYRHEKLRLQELHYSL